MRNMATTNELKRRTLRSAGSGLLPSHRGLGFSNTGKNTLIFGVMV